MSGKVLFILNDAPYGIERSFNALRLAEDMAGRDGVQTKVFLMGDAVGCAIAGQQVPNGFYHVDRMTQTCIRRGAEVVCCDSCLDARGIGEDQLVGRVRRATVAELAEWSLWADRVLTF